MALHGVLRHSLLLTTAILGRRLGVVRSGIIVGLLRLGRRSCRCGGLGLRLRGEGRPLHQHLLRLAARCRLLLLRRVLLVICGHDDRDWILLLLGRGRCH